MLTKCCAFTGHRPSKFPWRYDETDSRCVALKAKLTKQITKLAEAGVTDFFSGMAEGTDTYCAQIVLDLRRKNPALNLHCVLPCEGQRFRAGTASRHFGAGRLCGLREPGILRRLYAGA